MQFSVLQSSKVYVEELCLVSVRKFRLCSGPLDFFGQVLMLWDFFWVIKKWPDIHTSLSTSLGSMSVGKCNHTLKTFQDL